MKKKILAFICTFAVILFYASSLPCFAAGELVELNQNTPFMMSVLGDSIAAGYGLEGYDGHEPCYECDSYANILAEKYELIPGTTYFNNAVSGATTTDLLNTLDDYDIMQHVKNSDTILISIGGNDLLHVLWSAFDANGEVISENEDGTGFSFDPVKLVEILSSLGDNIDNALISFEANFNMIIDKIRENNPYALIIVNTLYDPFQGSEMFKPVTSVSADTLARFNDIIKNNATDSDDNTRYVVSDVAESFAGKEGELTNINEMDIHPNAQGHETIAGLLDTEITSHTFTTWIIDTSASADTAREAQEKEEAKKFTSVMFGFFFMLIVMMTVLFVHSLNKLKNE